MRPTSPCHTRRRNPTRYLHAKRNTARQSTSPLIRNMTSPTYWRRCTLERRVSTETPHPSHAAGLLPRPGQPRSFTGVRSPVKQSGQVWVGDIELLADARNTKKVTGVDSLSKYPVMMWVLHASMYAYESSEDPKQGGKLVSRRHVDQTLNVVSNPAQILLENSPGPSSIMSVITEFGQRAVSSFAPRSERYTFPPVSTGVLTFILFNSVFHKPTFERKRIRPTWQSLLFPELETCIDSDLGVPFLMHCVQLIVTRRLEGKRSMLLAWLLFGQNWP
ncbi:hypothetical protein HD554DRAFT_527899 [Boletus coccyginus]|nr:hypothetical protein HD554DRAFT_527899 [Boletus coccyginus]